MTLVEIFLNFKIYRGIESGYTKKFHMSDISDFQLVSKLSVIKRNEFDDDH